MSSLFTIALDFKALNDLANELSYDETTGEIFDTSEDIAEFFNEISTDLSAKLNNTMYIIKQLEASEQMLKAESDRLLKRKTTFANRSKMLRDLMFSALNASGEKKLVTDKFNFSIRKSTSVSVSDVELLPREYVKLTRSADKMKIKEQLKEGVIIDGCSLDENYNLGVK